MILHLDMDAFFASVEQAEHPELRGKPVIIGGGSRGVVATASYEARQFGIHSAMPMAIARRLCPHGHFISGRHERYSHVSRLVMQELCNFSPSVEKASIDEAFIDAQGLEHVFGSIREIAVAIKARIFEVTGGLTCSIGAAPVKFLAKICSDLNKPDGLYILEDKDVSAFLENLPIGKLPGVGARMSASLAALGIARVGQLACYSRDFLVNRYGKAGNTLYDRAHGQDPRKVEPVSQKKSESSECTLEYDTTDPDTLKACLLHHAEKIGARLRKSGFLGRTITLHIKFADFSHASRSHTLQSPINSTQSIYEAGAALLECNYPQSPVRLIGLSVSGFQDGGRQLDLPGISGEISKKTEIIPCSRQDEERRARLDAALDALRDRFGKNAVMRGRLFEAGTLSQSNAGIIFAKYVSRTKTGLHD